MKKNFGFIILYVSSIQKYIYLEKGSIGSLVALLINVQVSNVLIYWYSPSGLLTVISSINQSYVLNQSYQSDLWMSI